MSTSKFTAKYAYQEEGEVYCNDGREQELVNRIFNLAEDELSKLRNNPQAIIDFIDRFGTEKFLMNVGELKGNLVVDLIKSTKPKTCVELGGYVGYSALLFGSTVRNVSGPDARYYCLERNPIFAGIVMALVDLAGLSSTIKVTIGDCGSSIRRLHDQGTIKTIDFLFIDHHKPRYTADLKLCERLQLIRPGCSNIAADNMIKPGNPMYHEYVNMTPQQKIEAAKAENDQEVGNPKLVYKSQLIESWGPAAVPDGVEISRCVDELK